MRGIDQLVGGRYKIMPNWCSNRVHIDGSQEELDRFDDYVGTEKARFQLNKIIPMPENIYQGSLGEKEKRKYGDKNWYDWSVQHWGTKWEIDPLSIEIEDSGPEEVTYSFETAWGPPFHVYNHLVEEFPKLNISWYYRDEFEEEGEYLT